MRLFGLFAKRKTQKRTQSSTIAATVEVKPKPHKKNQTIGEMLADIEENQQSMIDMIPEWLEKQGVSDYVLPQALRDAEAEKWINADYGVLYILRIQGATVGLQKRLCIYADKIEVQERGYRVVTPNYVDDHNFMLRENKSFGAGFMYLAYRDFFEDESSFVEALRGGLNIYRKSHKRGVV